MDIRSILQQLKTERSRLDQAIAALEDIGTEKATRNTNRSANGRRRKRRLTPEGRKRLSDMMKKRWAERRKRAKAA